MEALSGGRMLALGDEGGGLSMADLRMLGASNQGTLCARPSRLRKMVYANVWLSQVQSVRRAVLRADGLPRFGRCASHPSESGFMPIALCGSTIGCRAWCMPSGDSYILSTETFKLQMKWKARGQWKSRYQMVCTAFPGIGEPLRR